MNLTKIVALALIIGGILGLAYGSFSYTKETHDVKLGPLELTVKEKQTVNVPVWGGLGAIAIGGVLLLLGGRKS
jgi:TRAP-type C4-dicarboxylate transport system permease small subunit